MAIVRSIHLPDMASRITLHMVITGKKRFAARAWLGSKVLMLGTAIIGCGVEIVDKRGSCDARLHDADSA